MQSKLSKTPAYSNRCSHPAFPILGLLGALLAFAPALASESPPRLVLQITVDVPPGEGYALDLLWGLVYPGKTDWEYPAQVFRHVRDVMEGLQIQLAQIGLACDKAQVPERKTVLERVRMMASYFVVKATGVRFDAKELQQIRFGGKDK